MSTLEVAKMLGTSLASGRALRARAPLRRPAGRGDAQTSSPGRGPGQLWVLPERFASSGRSEKVTAGAGAP